ncbi:MAG: class I SAM-dependent methyltransferase [Bacillota bacterium]
MAYKFNSEHKHKLETEQRKNDLPAKKTLKKMLLKQNDYMIDVGAGIGYFSIPAAEIVNPEGIVFAVDTSSEMIEEIVRRIKSKQINNIKVFRGKKYECTIENKSVDYILMVNVLHEVEDKERLLNNYLEKLKPNGKIGIIEFKKSNIKQGPPVEHKISNKKLKEYFNELEIDVIKEIDLNDYQYGIVGRHK